MIDIDSGQEQIKHYSGFIMNGSNMSPAINNGDHIVVDLQQRAIISGEIYMIGYKQSNVVCRLLLELETVTLLFDGNEQTLDESIYNINIIGRVIEVKAL
ncbi:MAG: S24/S26 family peptidase [Gammaproteobacteria bacterium]|nr:S24/S26 family peptidase [Gammaproteobacteria bacterium]MDH5592697.1 S24/S26 family peptidase [Gammaproteobacteria bacterium]